MGRYKRTLDSRFRLARPIAVHEQDRQRYPVDIQSVESDNICTELLRLYSPPKSSSGCLCSKHCSLLPSRFFVDGDPNTWVFSLALSTGELVTRRLLGFGCRLIITPFPRRILRHHKTQSNQRQHISGRQPSWPFAM